MPISAFNGAATIAAWQNWFLRMSFSNPPLVLPWPLKIGLELATRALLDPGDQSSVDFSRPAGEPALVSPDSVSWRVFKNPVLLFIGGVTAVIMELAEPRVRTGVGAHEFPSGPDPADASHRSCRYGDGVWCAQHGRGDDSPCSTGA